VHKSYDFDRLLFGRFQLAINKFRCWSKNRTAHYSKLL